MEKQEQVKSFNQFVKERDFEELENDTLSMLCSIYNCRKEDGGRFTYKVDDELNKYEISIRKKTKKLDYFNLVGLFIITLVWFLVCVNYSGWLAGAVITILAANITSLIMNTISEYK